MSFKKYRGPIENVEHAMMAHMVVTIECLSCDYWNPMYAWKLWNLTRQKPALPLCQPVIGLFKCPQCRRRVDAVIVPGYSGGKFTRPEPIVIEMPRCCECEAFGTNPVETGLGRLFYCDAHVWMAP